MNMTSINVEDGTLETTGAFINAAVLLAGVPKEVPVPSVNGMYPRTVVFSANGDFAVKMNGDAYWPSDDVNDGSASDLNPTRRLLAGNVQSMGMVSPTDTLVTMIYYI